MRACEELCVYLDSDFAKQIIEGSRSGSWRERPGVRLPKNDHGTSDTPARCPSYIIPVSIRLLYSDGSVPQLTISLL